MSTRPSRVPVLGFFTALDGVREVTEVVFFITCEILLFILGITILEIDRFACYEVVENCPHAAAFPAIAPPPPGFAEAAGSRDEWVRQRGGAANENSIALRSASESNRLTAFRYCDETTISTV
jgi:hypothetical protein